MVFDCKLCGDYSIFHYICSDCIKVKRLFELYTKQKVIKSLLEYYLIESNDNDDKDSNYDEDVILPAVKKINKVSYSDVVKELTLRNKNKNN